MLLGAPEKEPGGHPLGGREAGGGGSGSAREARWQVGGWGARQREWHGKDTADFKGSGRVEREEAGGQAGQARHQGHLSEEVDCGSVGTAGWRP